MQQPITHETAAGVRGFHVMAKSIGPICNLNCRYCFYLEKEHLYQSEKHWSMSSEVLESYIRQAIESQHTPGVAFAWQGGEPTLLGVDYFRNVVELQKKCGSGKQITNAFQTNGVLLDDEWCSFFAQHGFLIGLSIDGPREIHDFYRVNKGGGGSFDQVMRGLHYLKKHRVEFNTLTVVQHDNSNHPLEVYRFLREVGSGFMQFIPVVERTSLSPADNGLQLVSPGFEGKASVTEWSVEPLQYGQFLCSIYDEWVRHDVGKVFVQLFDVALESWLGMQPSLCVFRETCGDALVIEHNGDLYSCDHYVYPENKLGNIIDHPLESLVYSDQQRTFGQDKREKLPECCRSCKVKYACNGECPKHRFANAPDGSTTLNYLCEGYKYFYQHIDPSMRYMASELTQQRTPANVMQWIRDHDKMPHRRNEPCYCGSGKKFKFCHGV